jgi:hypothetical protein
MTPSFATSAKRSPTTAAPVGSTRASFAAAIRFWPEIKKAIENASAFAVVVVYLPVGSGAGGVESAMDAILDGHGVNDRQVGLGGLCFEHPDDTGKLDKSRGRIFGIGELRLEDTHCTPDELSGGCSPTAANTRRRLTNGTRFSCSASTVARPIRVRPRTTVPSSLHAKCPVQRCFRG